MSDDTIGHYRIEARLSESASAVVYRARDLKLDRTVALKVLAGDLESAESGWVRLLCEARVAAGLNHPHICATYDVDEDTGRAYLAMEYVEGIPLSDLLGDGLGIARLTRWGTQIAQALAHAHERGVIHGDIRSSNVLITPEGDVKVLDFGLGRRLRGKTLETPVSSPQTSPFPVSKDCTLTYAAPELGIGEPKSVQSDIWAFGVLLHEMATGRLPFAGELMPLGSHSGNQEEPAPCLRDLPSAFVAIIQRCLQNHPENRYETIRALLDDLEALSSSGAIPHHAAPRKPRRPMLIAMTLGAMVLLGGLATEPWKRLPLWLHDLSGFHRASTSETWSGAHGRTVQQGKKAGPDTKVWVNTKTGIYHCPGATWYGRTKDGGYMTQKQALDLGHKPAYGEACE